MEPSEESIIRMKKILSIITKVSRKTGLLGLAMKFYTVAVTDRRLIFAQVSKSVLAKQKKDLEELRKHNKAEGKGFFSSWADTIATGMSWYDRYLEMAPDDIMAETEGNFFLNKTDIISLKSVELLGLNQADSNTPLPFFKIKTRGKKYKFFLPREYDPGQIKLLKKWAC